jgi:prepilin-type processing-associated H-X9-DG protein
MREKLLGYLLGALDGPEQEEVRRELDRDPQLQRDLQRLEANLAPLEHQRWQYDPPEGLAEETCQLVTQYRQGKLDAPWLTADRAEPIAAGRPPEVGPRHRTMADMVIAAGVFFAAALLFFPAIADSRHQARLVLCRDNLHHLGVALDQYSSFHGGNFPYVPASGNQGFAGIVGPKLVEGGFLAEARKIICPASFWAERREQFRVPTVAQIEQARGRELLRLQGLAGGSYGYTLGYLDGDRYVPVRNLGRSHFALMSDAPVLDVGRHVTANHGGRGLNVLFGDLHVRYVVVRPSEPVGDDVFRNDRGLVEAGLHPDDSVIGPSPATPFRVHLVRHP